MKRGLNALIHFLGRATLRVPAFKLEPGTLQVGQVACAAAAAAPLWGTGHLRARVTDTKGAQVISAANQC